MVEFLSENFLVSLIKYRQYNILSFIKRIIDNCKEEEILDRFIASLIALFGNKGGIDSGIIISARKDNGEEKIIPIEI